MNKVIRRLTSGVFMATLSLTVICGLLNGCAQESSSTHVYTSLNYNSETESITSTYPQGLSTTTEHATANNLDADTEQPVLGAERFAQYLPLLKGKRVSLVVNQSALVHRRNFLRSSSSTVLEKDNLGNSFATLSNSTNVNQHYHHLLDALLQRNVNVVSVMSPEHGFRGDKGAGEKINSDVDAKTGLPVHSLYGATKKPTPEMLQGVDVIVFDIQDVGVRFYTYLSTLHYVMEAAFAQGIHVIVLDRPNPNGRYVDGPVLQPEFASFIGMHPIPVLHGMTLGELAQMMVGERWLDIEANSYDNAKLTVVPIKDYRRDAPYSLPVAPSPNLPNDLSIRLYPTLCFFEGTDVSIGRGTDFPFQLIGHPKVEFGNTPIQVKANSAAPHPKHENSILQASVLAQAGFTTPELTGAEVSKPDTSNAKVAEKGFSPIRGLDVATLLDAYSRFSQYNDRARTNDMAEEIFFTRPEFFDKLAGTDELRAQIQAGKTPAEIKQSWQQDLDIFKKKRRAYLLYEDIY
ncbi:exo-beta-N-acetylmuramidase NamZ domain-containing protein [Alteromonas sp. KUL106]|uniref:exo-beta-N-acetylmuramidase NamZ family protein n=1 Tax=Alteromonas sp. KUL106 TaxID=2480799 RepID=UPI0012E54083|nr:DUF1343 domain-containing protein [Alteromonas sp. KUL106]GFD69485.1 hypothetical protein KUL106_27480 [Alteromonas sp. KUL106]